MKVHAMVIDKNAPDWACGIPLQHPDGRLVMIARGRRLIYPRWWHRIGERLGWRWLQNFKSGF